MDSIRYVKLRIVCLLKSTKEEAYVTAGAVARMVGG